MSSFKQLGSLSFLTKSQSNIMNTDTVESPTKDEELLVTGSSETFFQDNVSASYTSSTTGTQSVTKRTATSNSNSSSSQVHTPVVRSRTSFSIAQFLQKHNQTEPQPNKDFKKISSDTKETGFLREIENRGFSGIWNHPITRCYFLMYLIWKGYEAFYFLRWEVHQYRVDFFNLHLSARKTQASRIFNTYLSRSAAIYIPFSIYPDKAGLRRVISEIKSNVDYPDQTLFDDLAFLIICILEGIYNGTLSDGMEANISGSENELATLAKEDYIQNFVKSPFYQAMQSDLRGTKNISTLQYNRAAERLMDMPNSYFDSPEVFEKVLQSLEAIGLDTEPWRPKSTQLQRAHSGKKASKAKSMTSLDSKSEPKKSLPEPDVESPQSPPASLKDKESWKRSSTYAMNIAPPTDISHTFVQFVTGNQQFCEYCFRGLSFDGNVENGQTAYQCESCGYCCHRNCRNMTRVRCLKRAEGHQNDFGQEHAEKIKRLTDKIQAVQKEIDIEMKIRDGVERFSKAKVALSGKKSSPQKLSSAEQDIVSQLENSNRKLELLKHEMQKCRLQLGNLNAIAPDPSPNFTEKLGDSGEILSSKEDNAGEVIRVLSYDLAQKSQSTKTFFISHSTTVRQLINTALHKFMLPEKEEDYQFSYIDEDGGEIPLREQDVIISTKIDFSQVIFKLTSKHNNTKIDNIPEEFMVSERQKEVLSELVDTETGYVQALRNIISIFLKPMLLQNIITEEQAEEIFCNIKELSEMHETVLAGLNETNEQYSTSAIINVFNSQVENFSLYTKYCGNQHRARRLVNRLKKDPDFAKGLIACEANPRLNKLSLADLLVKPMHRITRYPILLKRLLSHTITQCDIDSINTLINKVEAKVTEVNETVRKAESDYRIMLIDETLDFNNLTEKFRLANGLRELLIEKTFIYVKKNSLNSSEIHVMVFTDLLLLTKQRKQDQYVLFKQPIPFESCVLLDKPDTDGVKNMFQIIHLQQEIHNIQAMSSFDKNTFLIQAEELRSNFCSHYLTFEQTWMKQKTVQALSQTEEGGSAPSSPKDFGPRRRFTGLSIRSETPKSNAGRELKDENLLRTSSWTHLFKGAGSASKSADMLSELDEVGEHEVDNTGFSDTSSIQRSISTKRPDFAIFSDSESESEVQYQPHRSVASSVPSRGILSSADSEGEELVSSATRNKSLRRLKEKSNSYRDIQLNSNSTSPTRRDMSDRSRKTVSVYGGIESSRRDESFEEGSTTQKHRSRKPISMYGGIKGESKAESLSVDELSQNSSHSESKRSKLKTMYEGFKSLKQKFGSKDLLNN